MRIPPQAPKTRPTQVLQRLLCVTPDLFKLVLTFTFLMCFRPLYVGTTEEPVYDLKDHPDFKYRPGSIVIRVANFAEADRPSGGHDHARGCTGGQVLDNYPSGQVLVWWANNSTSYCWPQDLYKIGEYDSDDGELWGDEEEEEDGSSEADSWETESWHSVTINQEE